jgi:hypothetical protein
MYFPAPFYGGHLLRGVFTAVHAGARAGLVQAVTVALEEGFVRVEWSGDGRLAQLHEREREPQLIVATTVLPVPLPPDDYASGLLLVRALSQGFAATAANQDRRVVVQDDEHRRTARELRPDGRSWTRVRFRPAPELFGEPLPSWIANECARSAATLPSLRIEKGVPHSR